MTTSQTPRLGAFVMYTVSEFDAREIREARLLAGRGVARGNDVHEGDTFVGMIVRDFAYERHDFERLAAEGKVATRLTDDGERVQITYEEHLAAAACNVQVFLDGNDSWWATSRSERRPEGEAKGHWEYAPIAR